MPVNGTTGLPARWTDPERTVGVRDRAGRLLHATRLAALTKLYVEFKPLPETTIIEVAEIGPGTPPPRPS